MRIASLAVEYPSRNVSNEDILQLIRDSKHSLSKEVEASYLNLTGRLLQLAGSNNRCWLAPGERPFDLLSRAVGRALEGASLERQDVDVVICACVDRAFLEPSQASIYSWQLGLKPRRAFDVNEACGSFSRAAYLANLMLSAGEAKNVVIVSTEFGTAEGSVHLMRSFQPADKKELQWRFPAYTLGECASVTVLTADGPPWTFLDAAATEAAPLCMLPLPSALQYAPALELTSNQLDQFVSYGVPLHEAGKAHMLALWTRFNELHPEKVQEAKLYVPHTSSATFWQQLLARNGVESKGIIIFPQRGNVVTCSLPAGISQALEEGRLSRGDRVVCVMGAAGLSLQVSSFIF